MNITLTREELKDILQITENGLKGVIKRKKLKEKLLVYGYKLINTTKEGRNTLYEVEISNKDKWFIFQDQYNIKSKEEHTKYTEVRLTGNGGLQPRTKLIHDNKINISGKTAKRFDGILCKEKAMVFKEESYMLINTLDNSTKEITYEEYSAFWKDNAVARNAIGNINKQLKNGSISDSFADYSKHVILSQVGNDEGVIAVKFHTYEQAENADKILNMINSSIMKQ